MGLLQGKIAIVTGTSSGIGAAIAERFVAEGATVIAVSRSATTVPGTIWHRADVAETAEVDALVETVVGEHGRLDIVVNNAGVQLEQTVATTSDDDYDRLMNVNVRGVFGLCRAAVRAMATSSGGQGGVILNIGSTAANHADHGMALYNASKAAVHGLSRSIALDHGPDGIRCNVLAPGWIATAMAEEAFNAMPDPAAAKDAAIARHPVGRLGQPADVAALAAWLCSDEASYASGAVFTLDGGLNSQSPIGPT